MARAATRLPGSARRLVNRSAVLVAIRRASAPMVDSCGVCGSCNRGEEASDGDTYLYAVAVAPGYRWPSSDQQCSQRRHLPAASYEYSTVVPVVSSVTSRRRPAWSYK